MLLAVALAALWWWRKGRSGVVAFGLAWIVLPLLPAFSIGAFQWGELAHDRYLYLPSIGFALLGAIALQAVRRRLEGAAMPQLLGQPLALTLVLLAIASAYGIATARQNVQWASTLLLYTRGFEVAPNNIHTVAPLSRELTRRGRLEEAVPLLERAAALAPQDWHAHFILGQTCFVVHRYADAEKYLLQAIALDQHSAAEFFYLGLARLELHRPQEAEAPLRRAIELLPQGKGLHAALARAYREMGDAGAAKREADAEEAVSRR
jgi:tetratricopeptide (TPR) repeat protein